MLHVWNNLHGWFVGLPNCLVMWAPLFLLTPDWVGISQVEEKIIIKTTGGGRKKKQNTDLEQQNVRRWSLWHFFWTLCVLMCGYHENLAKILKSNQKCWLTWSSSSLLDVLFLTVQPHVLKSTDQPHIQGFECVTLYCCCPTPNWPTSFVFFPLLPILQVWSLCPNWQTKETF